MIKLNKFKIVKGNFPVLIAENAISKRDCLYLIKEIQNSKNFDDIIMGGRSRINKGSKNFIDFLKNYFLVDSDPSVMSAAPKRIC